MIHTTLGERCRLCHRIVFLRMHRAQVHPRHHACVLTTLPTCEAPSSWVVNACRKLLSDADPVVLPPSAVTRLSKLFCNVVSDELVEVAVADVALDVSEALAPLDKD